MNEILKIKTLSTAYRNHVNHLSKQCRQQKDEIACARRVGLHDIVQER